MDVAAREREVVAEPLAAEDPDDDALGGLEPEAEVPDHLLGRPTDTGGRFHLCVAEVLDGRTEPEPGCVELLGEVVHARSLAIESNAVIPLSALRREHVGPAAVGARSERARRPWSAPVAPARPTGSGQRSALRAAVALVVAAPGRACSFGGQARAEGRRGWCPSVRVWLVLLGGEVVDGGVAGDALDDLDAIEARRLGLVALVGVSDDLVVGRLQPPPELAALVLVHLELRSHVRTSVVLPSLAAATLPATRARRPSARWGQRRRYIAAGTREVGWRLRRRHP